MSTILGIDQFSINGIPSDIDAMFQAYPFGWYQISNGMQVGIMTRRAWPVYSRHYGGYHFFNPNPDGNWLFQNWNDYAEACAWLFLDCMKSNYGGCAPMIDVEARVSQNYMQLLFPSLSKSQQIQKGNQLYFQMLKTICDLVEQETGQIPVLYTGNNLWLDLGGQNQAWVARLPLMVAIYPYDNYTKESEYLAAIQKIMDGTATLPKIDIPAPWTTATYVQFTGRGPASLIPGYAKEANWAKTVDINIQLAKEAAPAGMHNQPDKEEHFAAAGNGNTHDPAAPLFQPNRDVNVRAGPSQAAENSGTLARGTIVKIDQVKDGYSHFIPMLQFPQGGWIFSAFLVQVS